MAALPVSKSSAKSATNTLGKRDEFIQKIEEELTCAICLGRFNDPKVLPCLHTYCKKCVENLVGKSQKKDVIMCPQCREEHTLPGGGAGKLLTSFTFTNLVKLLEVHKADEANSKRLTCENGLDDDPAVARCVDCDVYLCNTCCQMHKKMVATKEHTTVSLEEIKAAGEKYFQTFHFCPSHQKEVLKLYCRTCSKTICGDCTYVDHRSHDYVFINDIQEELRDKLSQNLDTMKRVASELKSEKEKADKVMEEHETNIASIHAEVDRNFEELINLLKDRQATIHNEIDVRAKKAKKPISANVEGVESTLAHLMSSISFVERLFKCSDACELATMAGPTLEQCKKLEAGQCREEVEVCKWVLEGMKKSKESTEEIYVRQIEAVQSRDIIRPPEQQQQQLEPQLLPLQQQRLEPQRPLQQWLYERHPPEPQYLPPQYLPLQQQQQLELQRPPQQWLYYEQQQLEPQHLTLQQQQLEPQQLPLLQQQLPLQQQQLKPQQQQYQFFSQRVQNRDKRSRQCKT